MAEPTRIGIIGGSGWLGGAIARALVDAGFTAPERLRLSYRSSAPTFLPDAFWTRDNQELVDRSDIVVVSVRPADWPSVVVSAKDKLAVSVMAGVRMEHLVERLGTDRVVRSLPNAAAEVRQSYTPWFASAATTARDRQAVRSMFEAIGVSDEVGSEAEIDYLTGLSGSGPAFPALLAEAMMRDAVARGLEPETARRAVTTVLVGTGRLLERHGQSPATIVRDFVEYRGATAAAIEAMLASSFDTAVRNGLAAAFRKAVSLGATS
jgi:pyrroline-5-carboxylate reductase